MERQNMNIQIEKFIDEFNRSVHHPILNREIGAPKLDESTLFFLLLPMLNGEEWDSATNTAAIAVGAVYTAFEAHDFVKVENVTSKTQQLSVLSGDYLSGIYYKLIASIENYSFIQVMSKAIGRINEIKTEFHTDLKARTVDNLDALQSIQADCVIQFLHTFGFSKYIPLATAGLSMNSFVIENNANGREDNSFANWTIHSGDSEEDMSKLSLEMEKAIEEAKFLSPILVEKIRGMSTPLIGKTI